MNLNFISKDIDNIINNYNTNKKLQLLNELIESTKYLILDDMDNPDEWRIYSFYNEMNKKYYYDFIPKLIN